MTGPDRNLALIRSSIDDVQETAHRYDAKVNDVLLAVTAGGLRELLSSAENPSRTSCCRSSYLSRCARGSAVRHGET